MVIAELDQQRKRNPREKVKMFAALLVTVFTLGFVHGDQVSTLSQDELKRYFSAEKEAEAPKYAIVYVEHVNSKKTINHVTAEAIAEKSPQFRFQFEDEEVHLTLKHDDSFLAPDLKAIRVLTDDGEHWEQIRRDCHYRGYVTKDGSKKSSAQISTCSGMMGAIYRDDDGPLYIEPLSDEDARKRDIGRGLAHIAYRGRQDMTGKKFCGTKDKGAANYRIVPRKDDDYLKRHNTRTAKHLDMHVVADKALYNKRGTNTGNCITAMMNSVTNGISWLNGDLTASMKSVTLITSDTHGLVPDSNADDYLPDACHWAANQAGNSDWDVVAVMTGLDISSDGDSDTLGLAYVGDAFHGACSYWKGSVSEMRDYSVVDIQIHETGHNLGCDHDSDGNACDSSGSIMAANANCYKCEPGWSSCSKNYYNQNLNNLSCM